MERVHLIVGGFPPGSTASHDMDFARRELLSRLGERGELSTTVSSDFSDLDKWLHDAQLLISSAPKRAVALGRTMSNWYHDTNGSPDLSAACRMPEWEAR